MVGVDFNLPTHKATIVIDASLLGWGVHLNNHTAQETWIPREARLRINVGEVRVVHLVCKAFLQVIRSFHIQVMSDNITTMIQTGQNEVLSPLPGNWLSLSLYCMYGICKATFYSSSCRFISHFKASSVTWISSNSPLIPDLGHCVMMCLVWILSLQSRKGESLIFHLYNK